MYNLFIVSIFTLCVQTLNADEDCGCGKNVPSDVNIGVLTERTVTIHDWENVEREYAIVLPPGYDSKIKTPALLYYHGWGSDYVYEANELDYEDVGLLVGVITVYLKGMSDYAGDAVFPKNGSFRDDDTDWASFNTGIAGDDSICTSRASEYEYESCKALGKTGKCNWQTCYDDILFTTELVKLLKREFCIDESQLLATGESNGGMFTYQLMQHLPHLFAGFMPIFGLPAVGHAEHFGNSLKSKTIFHYHGRYDKEVPPAGGESESGWLYESLDDTISKIASIQGCGELVDLPTPIKLQPRKDHDSRRRLEENIECWEYEKCSARVAFCFYDGTHTEPWPLDHMAELTFWFFDFHKNSPMMNATFN